MIVATPSQERAGVIKGIFFLLMDVHLLGGPALFSWELGGFR